MKHAGVRRLLLFHIATLDRTCIHDTLTLRAEGIHSLRFGEDGIKRPSTFIRGLGVAPDEFKQDVLLTAPPGMPIGSTEDACGY